MGTGADAKLPVTMHRTDVAAQGSRRDVSALFRGLVVARLGLQREFGWRRTPDA
eukprot:CAMPEP_0204589890 /NCGR_PEP_ID=MMETSP0661-20131031/49465_1 /ASSEMBLY_ACC=CAM_ASM_000606 /TAXON_ID=109239 /ORGANISM="Alexandrium margalefi, Strain AMGDE01CS-322" /LENGTH=53 /DNA_ID=CAMNT_0051599855 /DNA_START=50 /DNA_END=208 /DNA_ORIENTATION=-